jgi:glycosyltransferase involved in cell wall biosynthesis
MLYVSGADVSVGDGPGVNENEFIQALFGSVAERSHFLVPEPTGPVDDLPKQVLTFCFPHRRYRPWRILPHVLSQIREARRLLAARPCDLLIFRLHPLPVVPLYLTARFQIPYAIKTLGIGPLTVLDRHGGWLGKALSPLNRWMFRRLVSGALVADTDSELHAEELRRRLRVGEDRVLWIDNAVNTRRFFPAPRDQARRELGLEAYDPIVGYVGSRPWERGGAQLLEAAAQLRGKYPRLGVVIVGDGAPVAGMKRRAAALGLGDGCRFTGYLPYPRIPRVINSLDVGVSINQLEDRQMNSELKVRQYLACGRPIVISPGSNEFVTAEGLGTVVQPSDIGAVAQALDRWLSVPLSERDAFAQRAALYMHENLSMARAIERRLQLWAERMQVK